MADPPRKRATYQDLLAAPEHLVAEIVNGDLVTSPRPAFRVSASSYSLLGVWRDNAIVRVEPFDAVEIDLASLWARYVRRTFNR